MPQSSGGLNYESVGQFHSPEACCLLQGRIPRTRHQQRRVLRGLSLRGALLLPTPPPATLQGRNSHREYGLHVHSVWQEKQRRHHQALSQRPLTVHIESQSTPQGRTAIHQGSPMRHECLTFPSASSDLFRHSQRLLFSEQLVNQYSQPPFATLPRCEPPRADRTEYRVRQEMLFPAHGSEL